MNGSKETLKDSKIIVIEATYIPKLENAPDFTTIVKYMDRIGFVVYDMFNFRNRSIDDALFQNDIAFIKRDSKLRCAM